MGGITHVRAGSALLALTLLAGVALTPEPGLFAHLVATNPTTAWSGGAFQVNVPNVVRRSDIVLGQANTQGAQSIPIGNGRLGAAVWAAGGFTAQLNRVDTFPDRKSPGQVVIPGLSALAGASDYNADVDLYDATYTQRGGGMTATTYILQNKDELVVDVTGANPNATQTAQVNLWAGRNPQATAGNGIGALAETWQDNAGNQPGTTGQTFGSLAAITAGARNVSASASGTTATVSFQPNTDGTFRIIVAAPQWAGGNALATASQLIGADARADPATLRNGHLNWWHSFWGSIGLIEMNSSDGQAQYIENIRMVNLYTAAASEQGTLPGTHAGDDDLFLWAQDHQDWYPAGYWFWNLRMQVAADLGAGAFSLNTPILEGLYNENLASIEAWTQSQFGISGACVPETMRFNGNGFWWGGGNNSCSPAAAPQWNALTLTSGAEVSLWMWQTYLYTGDLQRLKGDFAFMNAVASFLLNYTKVGSDGKLHTNPTNAHETQWSVSDSVTDISAMTSLFPVMVQAAAAVGQPNAGAPFAAAIPKLLDLPRVDSGSQTTLLPTSADQQGTDVIGYSYQPAAAQHNVENLGLEPVWPYNLIGDNSPLTALAQRTFTDRQFSLSEDWSFDPIAAARLGMASQFQSTVVADTEKYQYRISGLAGFNSSSTMPYGEQSGVVAASVQEALAQDYDGLLRFAPAWPSNWDVAGSVFIQGGSKVDVQVEGGNLVTAAIEAGSSGNLQVRNPWLGQQVEVVSGADLSTVMVGPTAAGQFTIPTQAGQTYVIQRTAQPLNGVTYAQMSGSSATSYKALSSVSIGLPGNPAPPIVAGPAGPSSNVVGADAGAGGANVSWKSPSDPGSGSVTAYAVYAYSYTGPAVMEETTNPTMLVTGMAQNQYYTFTVTAWNGVGWGSWSNWSNWTWVT